MSDDFLDQKVAEIERRMGELRPVFEEYLRLDRAVQALRRAAAGDVGTQGKRRAGRPRGASLGEVLRAGSGTPVEAFAGRGTRAEQALAIIREHPGIAPGDLAGRLGIRTPYLYSRVLPSLLERHLVERRKAPEGQRGTGLWPVETPDATPAQADAVAAAATPEEVR